VCHEKISGGQMKCNDQSSRVMRIPAYVALAIVTLTGAVTPLTAQSPDLSFMKGKKVTIQIKCERAPPANEVFQLNAGGNLLYTHPSFGKIEFKKAQARYTHGGGTNDFTMTVVGSEVAILEVPTGLIGVQFATTFQVSGNTCKAVRGNVPGQWKEVDTSCRVTRCTVAADGK
jgi:hypothetical protein